MDDSLFSSSPVREERPRTPAARTPSRTPTSHTPQQPPPGTAPFDAEEAREAALQRELAGVRQVNQVMENILQTLERSRGDMKTVSSTVTNASTLLNTWTRLLSQTEHNQRLLLDTSWGGATQDLAEAEAEALRRQQEAEKRAAEEQRRREEARRKAEEDERRRMAGSSASGSSATRGHRGSQRSRGRITYSASGVVRRAGGTAGGSSSTGTTGSRYGSTSTGTTGTSSSSTYGYRGSNIGRGVRGSRAGGRGLR